MNIKSWNVLPLDKAQAAEIAATYDLPHIVAMLLQIRGFHTQEQIVDLLGNISLAESPFAILDMDKAVARIQQAVDQFERIAIYGDYDADGITATAILYSHLESMGADVMYYIPKREGEGYGMNETALATLAQHEVKLIVTVDNGISSVEEVEKARALYMDVVITDHHRPQAQLPNAVAVVDPHRADCPSLFKEYAGAGLALKLVMALEDGVSEPEDILSNYADLAALGTIGDVVALKGENRTIVRAGLKRLEENDREGLLTLMDRAGLQKITTTSVAYALVPRINATGRMGAPDRAVKLLTAEDHEDAVILADDICKENEDRREIEGKITEEAIARIEGDKSLRFSRVLVVDGADWHCGVLGIVAARLMERYGKPVVVLSTTGEHAKGSGRSYEGFSLFDAVSACAPVLTRFGGHPMAAGVTLPTASIPAFRQAIEAYAKSQCKYMPGFPVKIDCKLMPAALTVDIPEQLAILEPFGSGNTYPVFGLYTMVLESITPVGGGNHLRLGFRREGVPVTCMRFGCKVEEFAYKVGTVLDLAVSLDAKEFRGGMSLSVIVREMKPTGIPMEVVLTSYRTYEAFMRGEALSQEEGALLTPTREALASLYRILRSAGGGRFVPLQLLDQMPPETMNLGRLLVALDILAERKLIGICGHEILTITMHETPGKTDIFASSIFDALVKQSAI